MFDTEYFGTGVFVLADCVIFAGVLLMALRDVRSRIWPAVLGVLCHVIADLTSMLMAQRDGSRLAPWFAMSLWCLAWPLIGLGIVRFRPSSLYTGEQVQERREAIATQAAGLVTYAALLTAIALRSGFTDRDAASRGGLLIILLILPVLWIREVLSTHLRLRLTAGLRKQAYQDPLTGLRNRQSLINRIAKLENSDLPWVVLTLDLDGFTQVNDQLGHQGGDELLIVVSEALERNRAPGAVIARIGGDEFAMLSPGDLDQGRELAERLRAAIGQAMDLKAPGLGTSVSVGVGRLVHLELPAGPGQRGQLAGLVESAAALRAAKEGGRNAVEVYSGQVAAARERRLRLEQRLQLAVENGSVVTVGQPIVDLATGRLAGFESLARWTDDELGPVPPDEFIAVAEETGMVVALGHHLMRETLGAASGAGVFAAGLTLSVNASPIQLRVPGYVDAMRGQLEQHQIRAEQVIVEVTEAILVTEGDPAVRALAELNALGIGIAIDDFGTGYSALGYLRRLPVRVIKIDKSLTSSLLSEAKTVAIVEGVIRMAHRMGVKVTMEGIEDELEADSCRAVGADRGQGWLFGRPLSWDKVAELVARSATAPLEPAAPIRSQAGQPGWAVTAITDRPVAPVGLTLPMQRTYPEPPGLTSGTTATDAVTDTATGAVTDAATGAVTDAAIGAATEAVIGPATEAAIEAGRLREQAPGQSLQGEAPARAPDQEAQDGAGRESATGVQRPELSS